MFKHEGGASGSTYLSHQYIDGDWCIGSSRQVLNVADPYSREILTKFQMATAADVDRAYSSAQKAQLSWQIQPPQVRRRVFDEAIAWLHDNHAEIYDLLVSELGSTQLKAELEIELARESLQTAAALTAHPVGQLLASPDPQRENRLYHKPVGVVGVISPFNAPFFLSIKPTAPALALGNAVVIKPHELAPVSGGTLIAKMFEESGLPIGLLNVVVTDISEIGDAFVDHPVPHTISFTGSSRTGRHVAEVAGKELKRTVLELGGNSALIVLDDANLDLAVNAAVFSRFMHAGQVCMSANRVVVDDQLHDEFVQRYVAKVSSLRVGDPRRPETRIGPLISPEQAAVLDDQIEEALTCGAYEQLSRQPRPIDSGLYHPVVLTNVTPENPVSQVELFGPVVCIMRAHDEDDAVRIANATPYGLSGAVHSRDVARAVRVAHRIQSGVVHVNNSTFGDEATVPFGGVGASGNGRLGGEASVHAFTQSIWIGVHHGTPEFPY